MTAVPIEDRFWNKVIKFGNNGCWLWIAGKNNYGYGCISQSINGHKTHYYAHRLAYTWLVGPIDSALELDHLCRNRACVNPAHLEQVSAKTNILRGAGLAAINAKKTHCPHGHDISDRCNIYVYEGKRHCKACRRIESLARYYKNKPQSEMHI